MKLPSALPVFLCLGLVAAQATAQEPAPVYQTKKTSYGFHVDTLFRQEWTQDIFVSKDEFKDEQRRLIRVRPRVEFGSSSFMLGVGGDFSYGSDQNVDPKPALVRDNYDSRDARLDLAFGRIEPARWLRLEGGRFVMPVGLTEMIWDRDLRPQGGALTLEHKDPAGIARAGITGLWSRGGHVFDDDHTSMLLISGQLTLPGQKDSSVQFIGSYLRFEDVKTLESMIRRQNTRVFGELVKDYRVVDIVARVRTASEMPLQLVADYCWNTAVSASNKGLWLGAAIGSIKTARARGEYTYAKVDKDATLAAYTTDDFFWGTGWQGHRAELASKMSDKASVHVIGQLQKFKDSPKPEEREHNVKRLRVEIRASY
jgi:hypothetical protein